MATSQTLIDLNGDKREIEALLGQASRKRQRDLLAKELEVVAKLIAKEEEEEKARKDAQAAAAVEETKTSENLQEQQRDPINYQMISKFAWDQSEKFISIHITMYDVQKLDPSNVTCDFEENGFDLKVRSLNGKNLRLGVSPLENKIDIKNSKFKLRTDRLTVQLRKTAVKHWMDLKKKKSALDTKKVESAKDPQEGLMDMMKDLYQTGDEDMKRTISEAWTKGHDKQKS
eukprot:CAMPEP_0114982054 /NCGR_PEP_ID=MMETSP0216-20121206/5885_1 /TAXON_ID=223996 /ORGANISM="Protocruzia adherens, Strain Boccale" /LENGTH=229 /DNA_ID=CAMNT_0002343791 /DNA_START=40 /DNA_END=729 /DNA_ORIENTATION=+